MKLFFLMVSFDFLLVLFLVEDRLVIVVFFVIVSVFWDRLISVIRIVIVFELVGR